MRTSFTVLGALFLIHAAANQLSAQTSPLDRYIQTGLEQNIVLRQKNISLERAAIALNQAKALYLPGIDLQAGYQTGEGGRSISLPVGDLLNPVYNTLNQLTSSNAFPNIQNTNAFFLPKDLTDVKIATSFPIINKNIGYNKRLQTQQITLTQAELETYRRDLVGQIKAAYFNYLMASKAIGIYESALALAAEGRRTNEKLLGNGKGLPAYVQRAESEVEKAQAALADARKQAENARLYFNFLLNASPEQTIDTSYNTDKALLEAQQPAAPEAANREELRSVRTALDIQKTVLSMNKDFYMPKLNGYFNVGNQAERFNYTNKAFYYVGGLQLDVPLFHGRSNRLKIRQTQLDVANAALTVENTEKQLSLAARIAANNLTQSVTNYKSAIKQADAAGAYHRLIDKGYREGINTFLETVDARNQWTASSLQVVLTRYRVLLAAAAYERETATFKLP